MTTLAATYSKPTDYASLAQRAAAKWGVPASVLLGLIDVESGGNPVAVSSAGAFGSTQFMPATAARYGVLAGTSPAAIESQVDGAAHYLHDLGFAGNQVKALAQYNAGGNWQAGIGYANTVLARARKYTGADTGNPLSSTSTSSSTSTDSSSGGSSHGALYTLTWVALVAGGGTLLILGTSRATGLRRQPVAA